MADKPNTSIELLDPPKTNWAISTVTNSQKLYALAIIDVSTTISNSTGTSLPLESLIQISNSLSPGINSLEFIFDVNPKQIDMEEPMAVVITPTQNRGQFVEHQGQIYKNISISGTTGFRPNKQSGGIIPINPETGLPIGETTGFDSIMSLRNMFRLYAHLKTDPALASSAVMVWQNGKDGEFFIVEPITTTVSRTSSSPLTYSYTLQLRTISRLDLKPTPRDVFKKLNSKTGWRDKVRNIARKLQNQLATLTNNIDSLTRVAESSVDSVLSPLNALTLGLNNINASINNLLAIPRNTVKRLSSDIFSLASALKDTFTMESNVFNSNYFILNSLYAAGRLARSIYVTDELFSEPISSKITKKIKAHNNAITGQPKTGGSPTNLRNVPSINGTATSYVNTEDDIRGLAQRLLGDSARWKELVLVNNLKAPYISINGDGTNVLRPGDIILFPKATNASTDSAVSNTAPSLDADIFSKRLGRDIKLLNTGAGLGFLLDTATSPSGDLDAIEGIDNMSQALSNRYATEPGQLPTHPQYGFLFPLGTKALIRSLIGFKLAARSSLLQDSRISDVFDLNMKIDGNVLSTNTTIKLVGIDQTISTNFESRR